MGVNCRSAVMVIFFLLSVPVARGQHFNGTPADTVRYEFVNYDTNYLFHPVKEDILEHFFSKLDTLIFRGEGQVSIVHLGGSHIQSDVYPNRVRERLQHLQPGIDGGRGLIFPVALAGTNNPRNFSVGSTGRWDACRNTERNKNCNLGLTGLMVRTGDSAATITIRVSPSAGRYHTTTIRVFHYDPTLNYRVGMQADDPYLINRIDYNDEGGYTDILLNTPADTFTLLFYKTSGEAAVLELYGIELRSDEPGIIYHSLGVNGASIPSFLRCNLLQQQLGLIHPDLVILSLGTNDGFSRKFDPEIYRRNYIRLINMIREVEPGVDILLTVPNDVYFNRKRNNPNTSLQEEVIYRLAEEYNCGIWNFFQVMGGLHSAAQWYNNGMMQRDRIHFTAEGYLLKGELLYSAMLRSYGRHLERGGVKG